MQTRPTGDRLLHYRQELDTFGYTLVPPELACPDGLHLQLLQTIKKLNADAGGNDAQACSSDASGNPMGRQVYYLLAADPVFVNAVLNPVMLELARFLIREPVISGVSANIKAAGNADLPLHMDQPLHPYPESAMFTAVYYLTDVNRELGGTCFVPFSHHRMRPPTEQESQLDRAEGLVSIRAPAGTLGIWHGNTWHGAHRRIADGVRVQLMVQWCNRWMRPQEPYREYLPAEIVKQGGSEFAELLGRSVYFGWQEAGPDRRPGAAFHAARQLAQRGRDND